MMLSVVVYAIVELNFRVCLHGFWKFRKAGLIYIAPDVEMNSVVDHGFRLVSLIMAAMAKQFAPDAGVV